MSFIASAWKVKLTDIMKNTEIREYLDTTQFFLRIVTCSVTVIGIFLIRLYINTNNSTGASIAEVILFFFINIFGIIMVIYPWYLSVSNNFIYFRRLKHYSVCLGVLTSVLIVIRSILSPIAPFHMENPDETSVAFRVMSTLYHISYIWGLFLLLPFLIRRRQFLSSHGSPYSYLLFVFPFVILMFSGLMVQEWFGVSGVISYSPVILIILYYINKIVNEIKGVGGLHFDEVFIIAAGFVPIWLGSILGKSLMEISSRVGSVGIIVVVSVWRILIFLFEVMTIEIGRKASRFNQESAFSFCVIYTGAIYAEFLFLSVTFNSLKFWALLSVEFVTIVLWQGGIMIQFQNWIVEYCNSEWIIFQKIKLIWLIVIGEMPPEIAEKVSHFKASTAPPDVKLSLIRSRAIVVQTTWSQNDIKMSSEFQSLICASTAVACDMLFSYFNIGAEFITLSFTGKRELLYIYLANLIVLFVAQAIAKYELSRQVVILKKDVTEALNAVTFSYEQKMTQSIDLFRKDLKSSLEKVTEKRLEKDAKEFKESKNILQIASKAKRRMSSLPYERGVSRKGSTFIMESINPLWSKPQEAEASLSPAARKRSDVNVNMIENNSDHNNRKGPITMIDTDTTETGTETETDQTVAGDLQDILDVTACLATQIVQPNATTRGIHRRASGFMQSSFFETTSTTTAMNINNKYPANVRHDTLISELDDSEADWGADVSTVTPSILMSGQSEPYNAEGYVAQREVSHTGIATRGYQRRFCVLSSNKFILFYKKKSNVSNHVSSTTAHYNLSGSTGVTKLGSTITIAFEPQGSNELHIQPYTTIEQNMWYNILSSIIHEDNDVNSGKSGNSSICENSESGKYESLFGWKQPYAFSRAMMGNGSANVGAGAGEGGDSGSLFESSSTLPIHCGYLSKYVLLYREHSYYKLVQPGLLYCYKNLTASNKRTNDSSNSKLLFSLTDVVAVTQLENDKSSFEINIKDKTFKFEALSEVLAGEWCKSLITWMKYLTELSNASLRNTQLSLRCCDNDDDDEDDDEVTSSSVEDSAVEMVDHPRQSNNGNDNGNVSQRLHCTTAFVDNESNHHGNGDVDDETEQGEYFFVKSNEYSLFASAVFRSRGNWQKKWLFISQSCTFLHILAEKPSFMCDEIVVGKSIPLLNILSVDISPLDACCVLIHEKGKHIELRADSLFRSLSWRAYLLRKIMIEHCKFSENDIQITTTPFIASSLPSNYTENSTREIITDVLDTLLDDVEIYCRGSDAIEIEPFSKQSEFFRPFDSGKNPLATFLMSGSGTGSDGEETGMPSSEKAQHRRSTQHQDNRDFIDLILAPRRDKSYVDEEVRDRINSKSSLVDYDGDGNARGRTRSDMENIRFIKLNSKVDEDDFANKLKTQSFEDLNKEFWHRHRWYLTAVVCFVTLNVLSVTSYMIRETDF